MCRLLVLSCLLTISLPSLALADNATVGALRKQIRALKEEEKDVVKHIKERYNSIINHKKLKEHEKERLRKKIREEERYYLSLTSDEERREKIRAHYNYMRRILTGEIRLEDRTIRKLRGEERELIEQIKSVYHAKIRHLENLVVAAGQAKPVSKGKPVTKVKKN